jgi:hypothetical protein
MQQLAAWAYALLAASLNRSYAQASLLANGPLDPVPAHQGCRFIDRARRLLHPFHPHERLPHHLASNLDIMG